MSCDKCPYCPSISTKFHLLLQPATGITNRDCLLQQEVANNRKNKPRRKEAANDQYGPSFPQWNNP